MHGTHHETMRYRRVRTRNGCVVKATGRQPERLRGIAESDWR